MSIVSGTQPFVNYRASSEGGGTTYLRGSQWMPVVTAIVSADKDKVNMRSVGVRSQGKAIGSYTPDPSRHRGS